MNRRSILGLISAAPFAGKAVAKEVAGAGGLPPGYGMTLAQGSQAAPNAIAPLVERTSALRSIFADARALAEIRDELVEQNKFVQMIDPDIAIMRSWSDMAKITFQRQRNVEKALAELQEERWDRPARYVRALDRRLNKLMWGQ